MARLSHVSRILLCFSHLRWKFVRQRPQHLLSQAAQTYDVIYWEEPEFAAGARAGGTLRSFVTSDAITIITPILPCALDELQRDRVQKALLQGFLRRTGEPDIMWFYTPMAMGFAGQLPARLTVYDCMDELTLFRGASPRLTLLERQLMRRADLVFTGGHSLQRAKQQMHPNTHCFPSALDFAHFAAARARADGEPVDQAGIARPRIGYFGVLDERLDFSLVAAIAARRPEWQIILLGPTAKIGVDDIPRATNIHWLGGKSYESLPTYLAGWDAGLMPFADNEATRFISPTKTPEYLAAGVPLVSTPIADVSAAWGHNGLVDVAAGTDGIVDALQRVLERPRASWLARVDLALSGISWKMTWESMHARIQAVKHGNAVAPERAIARDDSAS